MVYLPIALLIPFERHQQQQQQQRQFSFIFKHSHCRTAASIVCVWFFRSWFCHCLFCARFYLSTGKKLHLPKCSFLNVYVFVCNKEKWVSIFIELTLVWLLFSVVSAARTFIYLLLFLFDSILLIAIEVALIFSANFFSLYKIPTIFVHNIYTMYKYTYVYLFQSVKFWMVTSYNQLNVSYTRIYTTYCT